MFKADPLMLVQESLARVNEIRKEFLICIELRIVNGAIDPSPEQWGKTTEEEKSESGIGSWPGVTADIKPPNATLRLYGGAAFERVMHEFRCATYFIECPSVSREKVARF
ncbi:hypothetical protein AgCh_030253 [Apium graveolens]